jgi:predicted dehydrogenase
MSKKTVPMAKKFGVKAYHNIEEMLEDETIEAIDVCVKEPGHYEIAKKALLAGKHVLCEKAFTDNIAKAKELVDIAKSKSLKLMVCYNYRYIDGKPFAYPLGDWVYTAPYAKAAIFQFQNGGLGTITGSDKNADDFPLMSLTYAGIKAQTAYPDLIGDHAHIVSEGSLFNKTFPLILKDFTDALLNDKTPPITGKDGIRALELEDAILKSGNYGVSVAPYLIIEE